MVAGPESSETDRLGAGSVAGFVVGALAGLVAVVLLAFAGLDVSTGPTGPRATRATEPARRQAAPLRIMPLGDSITAGVGSRSGSSYRAVLYTQLRDAGVDVDFVGSQRAGPGADPDHEGHGGWTVQRVAEHIDGWLALYQPDVVLVHLGTNNVTRGETPRQIAGRLSVLVDRIRAARPQAYVLVSEIVASRVPSERVVDRRYNARVLRLAGQKGPLVCAVEQAPLTPGDLRDTHHPNDSGYRKMADSFFLALTRVLPAPDPAAVRPPGPAAAGLPARREATPGRHPT